MLGVSLARDTLSGYHWSGASCQGVIGQEHAIRGVNVQGHAVKGVIGQGLAVRVSTVMERLSGVLLVKNTLSGVIGGQRHAVRVDTGH